MTVLGGVRIGNGVVVGANAVVAKDVPPYAVVVGNPARVIKYRFDAETIARLQRIRWWDWEEKVIRERFEEMKDAPSFAKKYDLPLPTLINQWPELDEAKRDGLKVYGFIPDFNSETERVWEHVLQMYMQDVSADDPMLLVLFLKSGCIYYDEGSHYHTRTGCFGSLWKFHSKSAVWNGCGYFCAKVR